MGETINGTGKSLGFEGIKKLEGNRVLLQFNADKEFDADVVLNNVKEPNLSEWSQGIVAKVGNGKDWPPVIYESTKIVSEIV